MMAQKIRTETRSATLNEHPVQYKYFIEHHVQYKYFMT